MRIRDGIRAGRREEVIASEFPKLKSISIDYAVLERAQDVVVVEAPIPVGRCRKLAVFAATERHRFGRQRCG
ncbi:MAG: hypothetical protein U0996_24000 [Planctomycetaceae bacterium]